jgi:hypothetical protein
VTVQIQFFHPFLGQRGVGDIRYLLENEEITEGRKSIKQLTIAGSRNRFL